MTVLHASHQLLEVVPRNILGESPFGRNHVEELAPCRVLHTDTKVRGCQKYLQSKVLEIKLFLCHYQDL